MLSGADLMWSPSVVSEIKDEQGVLTVSGLDLIVHSRSLGMITNIG